MTDNMDNDGETASRRLIREAKEEAWHARRKLWSELPQPSARAKQELAIALAGYYDLLVDYRGEQALDTPWDERDVNVDMINQLLSQTTMATETLNRRGSPRKERTVQLVKQVDSRLLVDIAKELDAIAKELGFAADVAESTHRTEINEELIEEVEQWRKQNLA